MSAGTQSVLFNAVPLFVLAAVYLTVAAALAPLVWRQRFRSSVVDWAVASIFPCVGILALITGAVVLNDRRPIGGHVWPPLAAIVVGLVPGVLLLLRWGDRALVVTGVRRAREAEERASHRDRELQAVADISGALGRAEDAETIARLLLDQVADLLSVEFVGLSLVDDERREVTGLLARRSGEDFDWWREVRLDLDRDPSGIASAVFDAAPVVVYDVETSKQVSRKLAETVGAKSAAFIPLVVGEHVIAVVSIASTSERRVFSTEELGPMRTLAAEAALALERSRSASALELALKRERLLGSIARKVRSELDLDAVMRVAVEETGRAAGVSRCFIRLGDPAERGPIAAEWDATGVRAIGTAAATMLPVSNLAARESRTVAVGDVATARELDDRSLGGRETLLELGALAVLATPIAVFGHVIGVFAMHRAEPGTWSTADVALAEAVARELGLAVHTARLLAENERRLEQQRALLNAAQAVTSELELQPVLERLVAEVRKLLACDAADCYLYDAGRGTLRCAAVNGLPPELVGFEFAPSQGLAGPATREGRAVLSDDYSDLPDPVPHPAYGGFARAIVAPMSWSGDMRGVLGVGSRDPVRVFDDSDADLLQTYATLASVALRNAESYEERSRQARVERGFYRIAAVLGEPLSQEETLNAVAQAAAEALGGAAAAALMPGAGALDLGGVYELAGAVAGSLTADLPALADAARRRRVLSAPCLAGDERFDAAWRDTLARAGYAALLAIPIEAARGRGDGLVIVFFAGEHAFTDDDLELAGHLARAATGALERSDLFETERSTRALSQQLAHTGSLLASELEPAAVLEEVVQQAPALLRVDACVVRLLDGEDLVLSAGVGEGVDALIGSRVSSSARLSGDVVQSRAPLAIADAGGDPRLTAGEPVLAEGEYCAYLGAPLVGGDEGSQGVLAVFARKPRVWREEEIEALSALAANTSAALSNAELYQRVALERERSVAILSNIADGIVAIDREGKVVLWNVAAERITGVPMEEALGRSPAQVLGRTLDATDLPGQQGDRLVSIRRGSDEVWLSLTEAVMLDPAGAIAGRIYAFRDISAERVVEQMKSDFVSTVSHELRTPLTSIYGFAETLLRRDVLFGEEERRTFLSYIASESERLTRIVDALLNVARLDTGDLQVQLAPTDIRPILAEAVETAEQAALTNGHDFVLDVPSEPLDAEADREKLRQILDALVDNAVKFSPNGGKVTIAARQRSDAIEVSVADEGVGISAGDQDRIFTKFYRADGSSPGGTGLGLFIARGLVSAMGGRMWVTSEEGRGASFSFELPLARRD